jgi:hypothetical protein
MIWDTFIFGTEDDLPMLECRLATLAGTGVRHLLVESRRDFHGRAKPLWYAENAGQFKAWDVAAATVHLPAPDPACSTWAREALQREAIRFELTHRGAQLDDLVMLSDVDEIPAPAHAGTEGAVLLMRHLVHSLQWRMPTFWPGTTCLRFRDITGFQRMRDMRHSLPGVPDAGWHLSWMGSPVAKLATTAHTELPQSFADGVRNGACYRDGWHLDGSDVVMMGPAVPGDWPRWVRDGHAPERWGAHSGAGERDGNDMLGRSVPPHP